MDFTEQQMPSDSLLSGLSSSAAPAMPVGKPRNIIMSVCIYILLMEMAERLCYYGLTGSIKAFLNNNLHFGASQSIAMVYALPVRTSPHTYHEPYVSLLRPSRTSPHFSAVGSPTQSGGATGPSSHSAASTSWV
jgi:hypothetical protein